MPGGGHPPAIAIAGNSIESASVIKLSGEGFIIGAVPKKEYPIGTFSVKPFTRLFIFSDGIYEVDGCGEKVCMVDDFVQMVDVLFRENRAHVNDIIEGMKLRQGKDIFNDDASLLEIEFTGAGRNNHHQ